MHFSPTIPSSLGVQGYLVWEGKVLGGHCESSSLYTLNPETKHGTQQEGPRVPPKRRRLKQIGSILSSRVGVLKKQKSISGPQNRVGFLLLLGSLNTQTMHQGSLYAAWLPQGINHKLLRVVESLDTCPLCLVERVNQLFASPLGGLAVCLKGEAQNGSCPFVCL